MHTVLDLSTLSAFSASFAACSVEVVEAFTIVLAVWTTRGWRAAAAGTLGALVVLALMVALLGPALRQLPIHVLQLLVGVLLLLFGLGWLRKATLRSAGVLALRDETTLYQIASADLELTTLHANRVDQWIGGIAAFKAVLLEGLEVAFAVLAIGTGRDLLGIAAAGALAACALVLVVGVLVRRPLARVPENTLKFGVGVMLSAFGVFWSGEGMGIRWPGEELALPVLMGSFLLTASALAAGLRRTPTAQGQ